MAAGLPCPPFSVAGQQLGADDDRDLFPALLRIVAEVEPAAVLVENVRGLMAHRFDGYRLAVETCLSDMGYAVKWGTLNAYDFGVPQSRTRSFMVAATEGRQFTFPVPQQPGATVGEALHDLVAAAGWEQADDWAPTG